MGTDRRGGGISGGGKPAGQAQAITLVDGPEVFGQVGALVAERIMGHPAAEVIRRPYAANLEYALYAMYRIREQEAPTAQHGGVLFNAVLRLEEAPQVWTAHVTCGARTVDATHEVPAMALCLALLQLVGVTVRLVPYGAPHGL